MKNILLRKHYLKSLFVLIVLTQARVYAQPAIEWDKAFGGPIRDEQPIVIQAANGGYFTVGNSASFTGGDKSQNSQDHDYWVVKFSATGTKEWDKTFGGPSTEIATAAVQTYDGGYLIGGYSFSGQGGEKSEPSKGGVDYWVVKLNGAGQKQWDKTIGGNLNDLLNAVSLTTDGGFLLIGTSESTKGGDRSEDNPGGWLVKLSANGNILWDKGIDGADEEGLGSAEETSDHGYILAGNKNDDYWVIKLDSSLHVVWDKTFGGSNRDFATSAHQTTDGGYIVGGSTSSDISGDKTESLRGDYDYWILKLNAEGIQEWQKALGGGQQEDFRSIKETSAGNFIVAGTSLSLTNGDKTQALRGESDYWIVKLSKKGAKIWDMAFGGNSYENCANLLYTPDGGYLISGDSDSDISGERTDASRGQTDYWFVKLAPDDVPGPFWLKYFKVFKETSGTAFEWQTVTENKTHHFEIEFSSNKESWQSVVNIPAKILSYVPSFYRQTRENKLSGIQYYRLKMTDASGVFTYSKTDSIIYDGIVDPSTTIRINAGGAEFTTATKKKFSADQYYAGIDRTSSIASGDILNTSNDVLYRSGRCSPSFSYNIPVANGTVDVILHFAETYFGAPGKKGGKGSRQFHVNLEGTRKLTNFDIYAAAGSALRAYQTTIPVAVTDGMLNIDFLTGAADLPRISAIEVIRTNYAIKPIADSYVRDGIYNNANFGDVTMLDIKNNASNVSARRSSYIRFQLPATSGITSAKLRIYGHNHENSNNISVHAYGVNNDNWTENIINKVNAPTASTASLGYVAVNNVYKYYEIDVTSYVKSQQQPGDQVVTLLLQDPNNRNTRLVFNSKENGVNLPQLIVQTVPVTVSNTREGVKEIIAKTEEEITIFPNPAVETLNINLADWHKVKTVELLDSRSDVVYHSADKPVQSMNIKELPTGIYFVRIGMLDGSSSVRKVLVRR